MDTVLDLRHMPSAGRSLAAFAVLCVLSSGATAWGLDITQCGQGIPRGETGVLQVDLDCPANVLRCTNARSIVCSMDADCPDDRPGQTECTGEAVYVEHRGKLSLNGHTLKGGTGVSVYCERTCSVSGPGLIEGNTETSLIVSGAGGRVNLDDLTLEGGFTGVFANGGILANNVSANHAAIQGLFAARYVRGTNITASSNGRWGIVASRLRATGVVVNDNGIHGVGAKWINAENLTATGNGRGLVSSYLRLRDSTVLGNAQIDLATRLRRPRLRNTVCGTSEWGVCQND